MLWHLSLWVPTFKHLDYAAHNVKYLMLPNVIGYHWRPRLLVIPSGRSVRLYTDGCVVNSCTGLMGPCRNQEEAQLWTTPPMHQIQPIGSIKRLFKNYRREHKAQAEDKQTRSIKKDEGRRNTKARESHTKVKSVILYFSFMNIVLEI